MKVFTLFSLFLLISITACSPKSGTAAAKSPSSSMASSPYLGDWKYIVPGTPMGDVTGKLVLKMENNVLKGHIEADGSVSLIEDIKLENNKLSGNIFYSGTLVRMDGIFEGDKFKGNLNADGTGAFNITATRIPK